MYNDIRIALSYKYNKTRPKHFLAFKQCDLTISDCDNIVELKFFISVRILRLVLYVFVFFPLHLVHSLQTLFSIFFFQKSVRYRFVLPSCIARLWTTLLAYWLSSKSSSFRPCCLFVMTRSYCLNIILYTFTTIHFTLGLSRFARNSVLPDISARDLFFITQQ